MQILITICARGGSKGIPGKNIKLINSLPLINYTIKTAKEFASLHQADIGLSTDDDEIKNTSREFGLFTNYSRPLKFATDTAGKIDVLNDLLLYEEKSRGVTYDYILDLDVTSPLRSIQDIINCFEIIRHDESCLTIFSVNNANRNPYFNMVEEKENGYFDLVKKGDSVTRQKAPKVYDMNASIYFYRRSFFEKGYRTVFTDKSLIYLMDHICFDLDHPLDFEFMDFLIKENKLDFEL